MDEVTSNKKQQLENNNIAVKKLFIRLTKFYKLNPEQIFTNQTREYLYVRRLFSYYMLNNFDHTYNISGLVVSNAIGRSPSAAKRMASVFKEKLLIDNTRIHLDYHYAKEFLTKEKDKILWKKYKKLPQWAPALRKKEKKL